MTTAKATSIKYSLHAFAAVSAFAFIAAIVFKLI